MFLSRHKEDNVYPCKPQFYYIKVGFKGSKLCRYVFVVKTSLSCTLYFPEGFGISYKQYACQSLVSGKNKINIINSFSSDELAQKVVKV